MHPIKNTPRNEYSIEIAEPHLVFEYIDYFNIQQGFGILENAKIEYATQSYLNYSIHSMCEVQHKFQ